TDHPAFVVTSARGRRARGRWFGRVEPHYFRGAPVRLYGSAGQRIAGRITRARRGGVRGRIEHVHLQSRQPAAPGMIGMWDLPDWSLRGDRLRVRVADDLVGCAILAGLLESLVAARARAAVDVVYTRAEEAGLLGATALARAGVVPREHAVLVIETSRELPAARIGGGPVLRVGDRMAIFDPGLAHWQHGIAQGLAAAPGRFRFQRTLMDGGTCEAAAFAAYGYRTSGLAIPLGNYHNMGPRGIAAERVSVNDLLGALRLLEALALAGWPRAAWPPMANAKPLEALLRPLERRLRDSASAPRPWPDASPVRRTRSPGAKR
ncbi:MAG: M28 family peptidase, partial [Candidatus Eisenbacteria bacterium]|nr:M28 family peptidase [Candidatus Eisenbacteria bacterium]